MRGAACKRRTGAMWFQSVIAVIRGWLGGLIKKKNVQPFQDVAQPRVVPICSRTARWMRAAGKTWRRAFAQCPLLALVLAFALVLARLAQVAAEPGSPRVRRHQKNSLHVLLSAFNKIGSHLEYLPLHPFIYLMCVSSACAKA